MKNFFSNKIVLAVGSLLLILSIVCCWVSTLPKEVTQHIAPTLKPTATVIIPTSTPVITPTTVPTAVPTVIPTVVIMNGRAMLGANIGTFVSTYGAYNDHSIVSGGIYHFLTVGSIDTIIAQTDTERHNIVSWVTYTPQDQNVSTTCGQFIPLDAHLKQSVVTSDGSTDKIYTSVSLAAALPTDAFTDAAQNPTTPGLFDVLLTNHACSIMVGTTQTA
jgi:hypothetical protein